MNALFEYGEVDGGVEPAGGMPPSVYGVRAMEFAAIYDGLWSLAMDSIGVQVGFNGLWAVDVLLVGSKKYGTGAAGSQMSALLLTPGGGTIWCWRYVPLGGGVPKNGLERSSEGFKALREFAGEGMH